MVSAAGAKGVRPTRPAECAVFGRWWSTCSRWRRTARRQLVRAVQAVAMEGAHTNSGPPMRGAHLYDTACLYAHFGPVSYPHALMATGGLGRFLLFAAHDPHQEHLTKGARVDVAGQGRETWTFRTRSARNGMPLPAFRPACRALEKKQMLPACLSTCTTAN